MISVASAQVAVCVPSTLTMRSPGSMPAAAAGAGSSASVHSVCSLLDAITHCDTEAMVVVACGRPKPTSTTAYSAMAISRFMAGPPSMMMTRFQTASL
jgi:hypothetical protein